jgi:hypothetical protein
VGVKECGVLSLTLHDDGTCRVAVERPPGLAQLMLSRDVADPYEH